MSHNTLVVTDIKKFLNLSITDVKAMCDYATERVAILNSELCQSSSISHDEGCLVKIKKQIEYWQHIRQLSICRINDQIKDVFTLQY